MESRKRQESFPSILCEHAYIVQGNSVLLLAHLVTLYHLQKLLSVEIPIEGDYEWWLGFGYEKKRNVSEELLRATVHL
jgi:hypothetical protein